MLKIKTPELYLNEPGILSRSGKYIIKYGSSPLIIGSETALKAVGNSFWNSLKEHCISTNKTYTFSGYPSEDQFQNYASLIRENGCDSIIGIGGGRVLDTAKAAGNITGVPVITIPTIAATCAAWAAVTIQYDNEGSYVKARWNERTARLILADTEVIFKSPVRYLFSGVVDTFAKFYETRPGIESQPESYPTALSYKGSKIAFDILKKETFQAIYDAGQNIFGQAAKDVVDAIIYLAGYCGSFADDSVNYRTFAHPFYHCSARLPHTRHRLHGEKVAFGIISQLFLENRPEREIKETIALFDSFHAAFSLEDLGIKDNADNDLSFLANDISRTFPISDYGVNEIQTALINADKLIKKERKITG